LRYPKIKSQISVTKLNLKNQGPSTEEMKYEPT
jgi:hypothetical protein